LGSTGLGVHAPQIAGCSSSGFVLVAVLIQLVMSPAAAAQQDLSHRSQTQQRFARVADRVLREGVHAKVPPHLSFQLGISPEEKECLVKQGLVRNFDVVQGFEVSLTNKDDVVLFVANETADEQSYYLASGNGRLRKVASVKARVGGVRPITEKDKQEFAKQKQFWIDRLAPGSASR
jgi:hypothetical protein